MKRATTTNETRSLASSPNSYTNPKISSIKCQRYIPGATPAMLHFELPYPLRRPLIFRTPSPSPPSTPRKRTHRTMDHQSKEEDERVSDEEGNESDPATVDPLHDIHK